MTVNNYYSAPPPENLPKSAQDVQVNNYVRQDEDPVSSRELQSPEAMVQEADAKQMDMNTQQQQSMHAAQTQQVQETQAADRQAFDNSMYTGLGGNLNVLV